MSTLTLGTKQRERILRAATSAPSKHNTQPWWFRWDGDALEVHVDAARTLAHGDPSGRETHIACGAAVFAARLGYASLGLGTQVDALPDPDDPAFVARVRVTPSAPDPRFETLYWSLPSRRTNRAPFRDTPIAPLVLEQLRDAARDEGTWLRIVDREPAYERLLTLVREATALEEEHIREERARWIAPSDEVHRKDGVPADSLGPLPDDPTGAVRDLAVGRDLPGRGGIAFEKQPTIAVLETAADTPGHWLTAGQALLRVLVTGTRYGVSASFVNQPLEDPGLRPEIGSDAAHYGTAQMVLRLGIGTDVPPTPRRTLDDVVSPPKPQH
ncbi:MAG: hypothetical protein HOV68_14470 [Streptomycetaceae bacterium]|nr:hypothetical protein [Streptomycetaceae bacterium]